MNLTRFASCALLALLASEVRAQDSRPGQLRVVELAGTPFERGLEHGTRLRGEIAELVPAFTKDLAQAIGGESHSASARFLSATHYDAAIRRFTPTLLDEVRGVALGSGQSYEDMLAYQLADEIWAQARLLFAHKCTTIGVDRDGGRPALVAQNMDLPVWMHAHPTVLRIRHPDKDLESLVVTLPGMLGGNGLNSKRVAVGVNTVLQIRACTDGLPVTFVVRGLLEQEDQASAFAFLTRVRHASGQAYTIGGPDTVRGFECSAGKVVPFSTQAFASAPGGRARTWHTNHPLANDDWSERILEVAKHAGKAPADLALVCARFDAVTQALGTERKIGIDEVVAALGSREHGVCNAMTYVCTVMVLGPEPELRIAPGAPDRARFEVLRFGPAAHGK